MAIEQSEEIELAKYREQDLNAGLGEFEALYDTRLDASVSHQIDKSERILSIFGTRTDTTAFQTQLSKQLDMGLQLQGGFRHQREKTDSPFITINPAFNSIWFARASMPFLNTAHQNNSILRKSFQYQIEGASLENEYLKQRVGFEALQTYALWVQAHDENNLALEALNRAKAYHQTTQKLSKMGLVEESSFHASNSNMSMRQADVLYTTETLKVLDQQLKHQLKKSMDESCSFAKNPPPALLEITTYLSHIPKRKDLKAIEKQIQSIETTMASYEKGLLPSLEAFTSIELNKIDGNLGDSLEGSVSHVNPNFTVGGQLSVPFGKSFAKSSIERSKIQKKSLELQQSKLQREIERDISNVWTAIDSLYHRIEQFEKTLSFESKKISSTKKEYELGRESFLTLLIFEQDYIQMKRNLLQLTTQLQVQHHLIQLLSGDLG